MGDCGIAWGILYIPVAEVDPEGCGVISRGSGRDKMHASLESKTSWNCLP